MNAGSVGAKLVEVVFLRFLPPAARHPNDGHALATVGVEFQQPSTWIEVTSPAAPGCLVAVNAAAVLP